MSTAMHLDQWREIKKTALDQCPVPVKGFALVVIGTNGESYYGASYPLNKSECAAMRMKLREIAKDVQTYCDRYAEDKQ